MSYDYIRQTYKVDFRVGETVRHTVTGDVGTVVREGLSHQHYVRVRFGFRTNGKGRFGYCHPLELAKVAEGST